ncbi:uncharacterized protein LOC125936007 [Panthera uncia]|uniref:uncharacterized protein LOC125936007 n=1 Tax=Panthera uncia TaxID=29064 RepID=UPI0020FF870A|nr:uncharacterized protein LOC125936007 [Panthera uncia]
MEPRSPRFDTPREPTQDSSRAQGRTPCRRQFLTGQKCPGASRDSRLRAPRREPAARAASAPGSCAAGRGGERGRPAAPAQEGATPRELTVCSAAAAGRQGTGRGRHNMAEHHSCSRRLPAAASGKTRQRAGSGSCGGGRGSTTSPSRSLPPPPCTLPRCHSNAAPRRLAPPFPPVHASRDPLRRGLGPPPGISSHLLPKGGPRTSQAVLNCGWEGREMQCPEGRGSHGRQGGDVVGQCRFRAEEGLGRREKWKGLACPGRTYRSVAERGAAAEWPRRRGGGARVAFLAGRLEKPVMGLQRRPPTARASVGFPKSFPPWVGL